MKKPEVQEYLKWRKAALYQDLREEFMFDAQEALGELFVRSLPFLGLPNLLILGFIYIGFYVNICQQALYMRQP